MTQSETFSTMNAVFALLIVRKKEARERGRKKEKEVDFFQRKRKSKKTSAGSVEARCKRVYDHHRCNAYLFAKRGRKSRISTCYLLPTVFFLFLPTSLRVISAVIEQERKGSQKCIHHRSIRKQQTRRSMHIFAYAPLVCARNLQGDLVAFYWSDLRYNKYRISSRFRSIHNIDNLSRARISNRITSCQARYMRTVAIRRFWCAVFSVV